MGFLLDSSILVEAEHGRLDLAAKIADHAEDVFGVAALTFSEVMHGVHRAKSAAVAARRESFLEALKEGLEVIPFDESVARVHARLWADLASKGLSPGAHDLIIGATAVARGWKIVTHNVRHFGMIPGLEVVTW